MPALLARLRSLFRSRHRRIAALGGVAVLVVLSAVGVATTRASSEGAAETTTTTTAPTTTTTAAPTTTTAPPPPVAPLTGLGGDFQGRLDRPALFVKIDNVPEARPQAGLNQADIVFEEGVEGNVSRLAAVFHSSDAEGVGPVRSVRTTDLELLPLFGRLVFASSGGNGGVVPQLHAADAVDVGHNVSADGFYRADGRPAPHNLFTSTLSLYGKAPEPPAPPRPLFTYRAPGEGLPGGALPVGGVALRFGGAEISRFTWDPARGAWPRTQQGSPHVDAAGAQVAPTNVVVLEVPYDRSGQLGRSVPHGIVTGTGGAVVLTEGQAVRGTWSRPTLADPLQLVADNGTPIKLTPGQTFVELPEPGGWSFV
jgi:hypothetical protein